MLHRHLKYPNLGIFFSVLFFTALFYYTGDLQEWVGHIEKFGYIGAVFAGMFFVSTFTVVPASAILILLADGNNIFIVSLLAGIGAMVGDYLIFRFVKDELTSELKVIFHQVGGDNILRFHHIIHTEYFSWLGPVLGAIIIASPFPDELGVGLLGIYKMDDKKFAAISFILNAIGILFIISAAKAIT